VNGKYEVIVEGHFSSAHNLRGYEGDCEKLHGHNWRVELSVAGNELDHIGLLVDFRAVKKVLREILDSLDHCYLNEVGEFVEKNPSTENIANYIARKVTEQLPSNVHVAFVRVWEGLATRATFYPE